MGVPLLVFVMAGVANALPLTDHLVDMTYVYDETTLWHPFHREFKIERLINETIDDFGGLWLQAEEYSSSSHTGTHMDAPAHTVKGQITVDQIQVKNFFGPAAVIDITTRAETNPDVEATVDDLMEWESHTGQSLNGSIILLKSGWGKKWGNRTAFFGIEGYDPIKLHFPSFAPEACQWLVDNRRIKGIGTETVSTDGDTRRDLPSHMIILGHGLFILENVANVDKLPLYGAKLYVMPMKIGKGSGAPTRIIASIPKVINDLPSNLV